MWHYLDSIGVYKSLHKLLNDIIILTRSGWVAPSHILWYYHISQWRWPWWTSLCSTTSEIFVWTEKTIKQIKKHCSKKWLFLNRDMKHFQMYSGTLLKTILSYNCLSFLFFCSFILLLHNILKANNAFLSFLCIFDTYVHYKYFQTFIQASFVWVTFIFTKEIFGHNIFAWTWHLGTFYNTVNTK